MAMSRHYAASSSAIRSIDAEGFAHILDAAREQGRLAGLREAADLADERATKRETAAEEMHNAGEYRDAAMYRTYATAERSLAGTIRTIATKKENA